MEGREEKLSIILGKLSRIETLNMSLHNDAMVRQCILDASRSVIIRKIPQGAMADAHCTDSDYGARHILTLSKAGAHSSS